MAAETSIMACLKACGVDTASLAAQAAKLVKNEPKITAESEQVQHLVAGVFHGATASALAQMLANELLAKKK